MSESGRDRQQTYRLTVSSPKLHSNSSCALRISPMRTHVNSSSGARRRYGQLSAMPRKKPLPADGTDEELKDALLSVNDTYRNFYQELANLCEARLFRAYETPTWHLAMKVRSHRVDRLKVLFKRYGKEARFLRSTPRGSLHYYRCDNIRPLLNWPHEYRVNGLDLNVYFLL